MTAQCRNCGTEARFDPCDACYTKSAYAARAEETYTVTVADRAGEYLSEEWSGLAAACARVRVLARKFPDKVFAFSSPDRCDYDTNGLDDDESELLTDAMFAGRADARGAA